MRVLLERCLILWCFIVELQCTRSWFVFGKAHIFSKITHMYAYSCCVRMVYACVNHSYTDVVLILNLRNRDLACCLPCRPGLSIYIYPAFLKPIMYDSVYCTQHMCQMFLALQLTIVLNNKQYPRCIFNWLNTNFQNKLRTIKVQHPQSDQYQVTSGETRV